MHQPRRRRQLLLLQAQYALLIKWTLTETMFLPPSASVSQNFPVDNTIPSRTGLTCTQYVLLLSIFDV